MNILRYAMTFQKFSFKSEYFGMVLLGPLQAPLGFLDLPNAFAQFPGEEARAGA